MKEAEVAQAQPAAETATVAAPPLAPEIQQVLALQRSAGNRAVARMICAQRTALARATKTVNEWVKEETYGSDNVLWLASFDLEFDSSKSTLFATVRIQLQPDAGVSEDDVKWVKEGTIKKFAELWDARFTFHEHHTLWFDSDWLFRPRIEFTDNKPHAQVKLHPGKSTHSNRTNWYVMRPEPNAADPSKSVPAGYAEVEHAHEVSHMFGLFDEYEDANVKDRKVFKDHSLLGDYANEGFDKVEVKERHGERMAKIIGSATGKELTSKKNK